MQNYFGNIIWTNHALKRLNERQFPQEMALTAFKYPDEVIKNKDGSTEYKKRINNSFITTIAKQNEKKEWVVISCWIDPPIPGTDDYKKKRRYQEYRNSSGWKKLFLILKNQLGF